MTSKTNTRRTFLKHSGVAIGGSLALLNMPMILAAAQAAEAQRENATGWVNISAAEAVEFAAVTDQIFPPDEQPGAAEAGAVHFMDVAIGGFMAGAAGMLREGLAALHEQARKAHPDATSFSTLTFDQQTAVLKTMEDSNFFGTMHFMTMAGLFAMPSYGGNRDKLGWQIIGFDDRHVWHPPFGHYDAAYAEEQNHAGS